MRNFRFARVAGGMLCLALLSPTPGRAQDPLATTGAVNLLAKVSGQIAAARTVEYTSVVRAVDKGGQPVTFYVHAKIRRPSEARLSVSPKALDAPDAIIFVLGSDGITGYDAAEQRTGHQTPSAGDVTLPFGFTGLEPAFKTVAQGLAPAPLMVLFPSDTRNPLTITRQNLDMLNALLVTSRFETGMIGQQKMSKLWVDTTTSTPRRLVTGDVLNGTERVGFVEDFTTFTLNPSLPDDTFHWTPPVTPQVVQDPPPAPVQPVPTRPASPKRPRKARTVKKGHRARTRSSALTADGPATATETSFDSLGAFSPTTAAA